MNSYTLWIGIILVVLCNLTIAEEDHTPLVEDYNDDEDGDDNVNDEEPKDSIQIKVCSRYDENRDNCLKEQIQNYIKKLAGGIEQLNIPPYDPLETVDEVYEYRRGDIYGNVLIKKAETYGISKAIVKDVRTEINDDMLSFEIDMKLKRLFTEGYYRGRGEFNSMKFNSKGFFNVSLNNMHVTLKMSGIVIEINGEKYMNTTGFEFDPKVKSLRVYATGLVPDPNVNSLVIDLANQYWRNFYEMMLPDAKLYWEPILIEASNKISLKVPIRMFLSGFD